MERLHKVMARAGVASRRACEALISAGRVQVNGQIVSVLGSTVDPERDVIHVDGKPLEPCRPKQYIMLHKPRGCVTTARDPEKRPTVMDLVTSTERLFPVGRLDADSEGLLLLTNDGDLSQRLTHPSFEHEKEYHVLVQGRPLPETLQRLSRGITLSDGLTCPARVTTIRDAGPDLWLRWIMHEGRNRQIRRMCEQVGHPVRRIIRTRVGPLELGSLPVGQSRHLQLAELEPLLKQQKAAPGSLGKGDSRP